MSSTEIFTLRSAKPSLAMRFAEWSVGRMASVFPDSAEETREQYTNRTLPNDDPMPPKFEQRFKVEEWELEGQKCVTLHPKAGAGSQHILYFHGGGFVLPINAIHWTYAAKLVDQTGASITMVLYDLVPEASYKSVESLADQAFARLSETWASDNIIVAGDSAGAHMALCLTLRLKKAKAAMPGKLLLLSPWLDLTLKDEAALAVEPKDVMLKIKPLRVMGEFWAGERDPGAPECSPLYADLSGLPPTVILQGRHDLFVIDCRNFMARAREVSAPVTLYEYAGAPHVFMLLPLAREGKDAMGLIKGFLAE